MRRVRDQGGDFELHRNKQRKMQPVSKLILQLESIEGEVIKEFKAASGRIVQVYRGKNGHLYMRYKN